MRTQYGICRANDGTGIADKSMTLLLLLIARQGGSAVRNFTHETL